MFSKNKSIIIIEFWEVAQLFLRVCSSMVTSSSLIMTTYVRQDFVPIIIYVLVGCGMGQHCLGPFSIKGLGQLGSTWARHPSQWAIWYKWVLVWSATILPGTKPIIPYTGIDTQSPEVQNYVIPILFPANYSDPYLRFWVKPNNNPLVVPVESVNASAFCDPTTAWWGKDRGIAYLYRSRDVVNWVKAKHPADTGMWECLDF